MRKRNIDSKITSPMRTRSQTKKLKLDQDESEERLSPLNPGPSTSETSKNEDTNICPICLEDPVHPISLKCDHIFCFLCAKGLSESLNNHCPICRAKIPLNYFKQKKILQRSRSDLESSTNNNYQWFYEGKSGWWKFERRCNDELEQNYQQKIKKFDLMICGQLYVIDFDNLVQYRKNILGKKRKIKRDYISSQSIGVAGLVEK